MLCIDSLSIVLVAVGLAMDAFAVSIARGMATNRNRLKSAILVASFFGGFQMLMPAIGWYVGQSLNELITGIDHWIAFGLLMLIGGRMVYDSTKTERAKPDETLRFHVLLTLSVATSIDALMMGLSFAFLQTSIIEPILAIGVITFSLCILGFVFGCGLGRFLGDRVKIAGGIILIAIGIRILVEHLA